MLPGALLTLPSLTSWPSSVLPCHSPLSLRILRQRAAVWANSVTPGLPATSQLSLAASSALAPAAGAAETGVTLSREVVVEVDEETVVLVEEEDEVMKEAAEV